LIPASYKDEHLKASARIANGYKYSFKLNRQSIFNVSGVCQFSPKRRQPDEIMGFGIESARNSSMSVGNCHLCVGLLETAALRIKQHLDATTQLTLAMRKDSSDEEITALEKTAHDASAIRLQAVIDYKRHTREHTQKSATVESIIASQVSL
jgi:hypothetical protein